MTDSVETMETERKYTPPEALTDQQASEAWKMANLGGYAEKQSAAIAEAQTAESQNQINEFWARQQGTAEATPSQDGSRYNQDLHSDPLRVDNGAATGEPNPQTVAPEVSAPQAASSVIDARDRFRQQDGAAAQPPTGGTIAELSRRSAPEGEDLYAGRSKQELDDGARSYEFAANQAAKELRDLAYVAPEDPRSSLENRQRLQQLEKDYREQARYLLERARLMPDTDTKVAEQGATAPEQTEQRIPEVPMRLPDGSEVVFRNMTRSKMAEMISALNAITTESPAGESGKVEQGAPAAEAKNPVEDFKARTESNVVQLEQTNPEHGFQVRAWLEQGAKGMKEWAKGLKEDALFSAFKNSKAKEIIAKWPDLLKDLEDSTENVDKLREVLGKRKARLARNQGFMQRYVLGRFSSEARAVTTGQKDLQNEQNIWRDRALRSEQTRIQADRLVRTLTSLSRLNPSLKAVAASYTEQLSAMIDQHDQLIGRRRAAEAPPVAAEPVTAQPAAAPAAEAAPAVAQAQPAPAETSAARPVAA